VHRARVALVTTIGLVALAGSSWLVGQAIGDPATAALTTPAPADNPAADLTAAVAAGTHARIDGPHGPIHVWIPAGYHADGAATIVYVHGYWTNVDDAWTAYQLPEQFAMSALNAMFICPEAPSKGQGTPINYPDLTQVIRLAEDAIGQPRGSGPLVAFGHSGAYRTLETWLDEPLLDTLIMFDATYADNDTIKAWYQASPHHRLITVGEDTMLWTEELARAISDTVTLDRFPPSYDAWPPEARAARHLYVRSQWLHMPLVTDGNAIPLLLRLIPAELLPNLPWKHPLGVLPPLPDAAVPPGVPAADADAGVGTAAPLVPVPSAAR
jgi:hypothetical protein